MSTMLTDKKKINILLVEDNPGDARLIKEMLKADSAPFELETVDRLSLAFDKIKSIKYDVMLLDLGLPDSQGLETMQKVRKLAADLPIIIMTGMADEKIGIQAVEQGAQDFLIKWEASEAVLARTISYAIERKKADERLRKSEQRLELAVVGADLGLWDWEIKANQITYNQRGAEIIGVDSGTLRMDTKTLVSMAHPEDVSSAGQKIVEHLNGETHIIDIQYRVNCRSGLWCWVQVNGKIVERDENGKPLRAAGIIKDINELKISEIRERARFGLLNKLRSAKTIDECLQFGCKALSDSKLFKRAAFIFYDADGNIINFGQIGLDKNEAGAIKRGSAPDKALLSHLTQPKYRISKSFFIGQGSQPGLEHVFPNISSESKEEGGIFWKPGDTIITPIFQQDNNEYDGLISVAFPFGPQRPPSHDHILRLEEIVDMVTIRAREIRHAEALNQERQALAEKNVALKEIMSVVEAEKMEIRKQIAGIIDQVLKPAVNRLIRRDGTINKTYYDLLKYNLDELALATGGALHMSSKLSPREMEICSMIKNGSSSKDIAEALDIALVTVQKHREVIRKKLGLTNKNINLTTHLRNL